MHIIELHRCAYQAPTTCVERRYTIRTYISTICQIRVEHDSTNLTAYPLLLSLVGVSLANARFLIQKFIQTSSRIGRKIFTRPIFRCTPRVNRLICIHLCLSTVTCAWQISILHMHQRLLPDSQQRVQVHQADARTSYTPESGCYRRRFAALCGMNHFNSSETLLHKFHTSTRITMLSTDTSERRCCYGICDAGGNVPSTFNHQHFCSVKRYAQCVRCDH